MLTRRDDTQYDFPFEDYDFDPLHNIKSTMRGFYELPKGILDRRLVGAEEGTMFNPEADISETPEAYKISIDMPGMKKHDIHIEVDEKNEYLTVSGERVQEAKENKEDYHLVERIQGKFKRVFSIPRNANADIIRARLDHGVLNVVVPKKNVQTKPNKTISVA